MTGTIVNFIAIVIGGGTGLLLKNGLNERIKAIITQAIGLIVLFSGISGSISKMMLPEANTVVFIFSLVIGGIIGETLQIDKKFNAISASIDNKFGGGNSVSVGFMKATMLFCIGAMAIVGSIESGVTGNHQILFAKSVIDGITAVILASTYGIGVLFSAVAVLIYQGSITFLSIYIAPYLTSEMIRELSIVGGILIACLGLDMLGIKKIKVENFIPALFLPIFYYLFIGVFPFLK